MKTPRKQIPPERQALYYGGMALMGLGLLLFLSTFVLFAANFGNFENFEGNARSQMCLSFGGMALMAGGSFLMNIGVKGWAGSGVVLDPEKAREDVEPWTRMVGGVADDALSEVELAKKLGEHLAPQPPLVKVRCRHCQALNDESAKFCNQCAAAL